jgi:hypothetical protein
MILGARDCIDILRRLYVYVANMDILQFGLVSSDYKLWFDKLIAI